MKRKNTLIVSKYDTITKINRIKEENEKMDMATQKLSKF